MTHEPFHQAHDVFLREEGRLDIELGELGLAIRAQVLVTEAANDLIVAIEPRHHQQLLEDLRRLRKREELAGMRAARHEIVARAFRRRLREHRRFEIDEAVAVEIAAHRARDRVAQAQPLRHHLATQVEIAILEAHLFAHVVIELERQRLGLVQHLELARQQLHLAGAQVGVGRGARARTHQALHADHELAAQPLGFLEHGRRIGIEHHLQQTLAIAQVDENHAPVVAPPMHPAGNRNLLSGEAFVDKSAVMGTHGGSTGRALGERAMLQGAGGGMTTPQVMIIFIAASTVIWSSTTSVAGTMTMNPEVGFGVVGNVDAGVRHAGLVAESRRRPPSVMKPMLHTPVRGYWIITTLRNELLCENTLSAKLFTPP